MKETNDQFLEMERIVNAKKKRDEEKVQHLVDLSVEILKVVTDKCNLPEHQAFYRLLFQHPKVKQYGGNSIR